MINKRNFVKVTVLLMEMIVLSCFVDLCCTYKQFQYLNMVAKFLEFFPWTSNSVMSVLKVFHDGFE